MRPKRLDDSREAGPTYSGSADSNGRRVNWRRMFPAPRRKRPGCSVLVQGWTSFFGSAGGNHRTSRRVPRSRCYLHRRRRSLRCAHRSVRGHCQSLLPGTPHTVECGDNNTFERGRHNRTDRNEGGAKFFKSCKRSSVLRDDIRETGENDRSILLCAVPLSELV